jgi:hypothetical protein
MTLNKYGDLSPGSGEHVLGYGRVGVPACRANRIDFLYFFLMGTNHP